MKRLGIVVLITIGFLCSNTANSYYNSNSNIPVVDMMLTMMDMMARVMRGDRLNNFSRYPYSPLPYSGLPMSPAYPFMSPLNNYSPWSNFAANNPFTNSTPNDFGPENQDNSEHNKTSFFGTNLDKVWESMENNIPGKNNPAMNGIWQAMSGDIMAIYKDHYFIWTDGERRHLAGSIVIKGKQMVAYIPANKRYLKFQFYRENDKFAVRDKNGQIYIFKKLH